MSAYQGPCFAFGWWWIIPLVMILFCAFMMIMMRKRMPCGMGMVRGMPGPATGDETPSIAPTDSADEILDKRYALGEISREEYNQKKADLAGKP